MNKLHLCCGDIYLKGYENLDIQGTLAEKCSPEDVEANSTTLDQYFKYDFGSPRRQVIIDGWINLLLPWDGYEDESIDEIVMISAIEHFTEAEAEFIMSEIKRILKTDGVLKIDFPNVYRTIIDYVDDDPDLCMRLLYCNHKDEFSVHKWGYTPDTFLTLLGDNTEWKEVQFKQNLVVNHDYPMVGCIAKRVR